MSKALVIVSSGDKGKALTGIMWATNALKHRWVDEVRLILFGPVEELVANGDEDLLKALSGFASVGGEPLACRRVAEVGGYLDRIEGRVRTEYVGSIIARLIDEGFVPLVF
ncbi:MAG: hypothetical protein F7B20_05480 [Aeropyrum sp.]|nr:hypothetical protein [Aeropyrum sp.]MCE4615720.1 hypothetical protein [Aeropyrum sp.]